MKSGYSKHGDVHVSDTDTQRILADTVSTKYLN